MGNVPIKGASYQPLKEDSEALGLPEHLQKLSYILEGMREADRNVLKDELESCRTRFILNNTASMSQHWQDVKEIIVELIQVVALTNSEGCDVYFSHAYSPPSIHDEVQRRHFDQNDAERIRNCLLALRCSTREVSFHSHLHNLVEEDIQAIKSSGNKARKLNYIIMTSKCTSISELIGIVKSAVSHIDENDIAKDQIGFQFVQIGGDPDTSNIFSILDDSLKKSLKRDIVDSTKLSEHRFEEKLSTIIKILLGGVLRRIDDKGAYGLRQLPWLFGGRYSQKSSIPLIGVTPAPPEPYSPPQICRARTLPNQFRLNAPSLVLSQPRFDNYSMMREIKTLTPPIYRSPEQYFTHLQRVDSRDESSEESAVSGYTVTSSNLSYMSQRPRSMRRKVGETTPRPGGTPGHRGAPLLMVRQ